MVIAAITSCTNTSNPSVMLAAGLLAKKAVERGLKVKPWVKTSLAPGSKVVTDYYRKAGLTPYLEQLNFHLVGFGCTTCIGNSGPLPEPVAQAVQKENLVVAAVLSGNRNFEGRINPLVKANYLASPPLVVAYALAGTMDIDLAARSARRQTTAGKPVYLRDIWPSNEEVRDAVRAIRSTRTCSPREYGQVFDGDANWQSMPVPDRRYLPVGRAFHLHQEAAVSSSRWRTRDHGGGPDGSARAGHAGRFGDHRPHLAGGLHCQGQPGGTLPDRAGRGAEGLQLLRRAPRQSRGDGARHPGQHPAAQPARAGNRRRLDACTCRMASRCSSTTPRMQYQREGVPLVILAGKEYGSGSSRDWAAKGVALLGVRAVIAESFERIHRTNLVGMGVLPLQFAEGQSAASLKLTGQEIYHIEGLRAALEGGPRSVRVRTVSADGSEKSFAAIVRVDTPQEVEYYYSGGILPYVLRQLATA